jgi:transcriptional regulator with XRE-family HTH domain
MNEKKINQFISHQLVKAREELGFTQMKVEQDKVMKQSTLSKIENGVKKISAAKLFCSWQIIIKNQLNTFLKNENERTNIN